MSKVQPQGFATLGDQCRSRQLEDVTMPLEGTAQAILAASLLRLCSPPAQGIGSEEDVFPGSPA
jgi:hypothetical protein